MERTTTLLSVLFSSLKQYLKLTLFLCILSPFITQAQNNFDKEKDLFVAQFDNYPDSDDVQSQAAVASILAHPDFEGVNYLAVHGAYGDQPSGNSNWQFIDTTTLFDLAFGRENIDWIDARADRVANGDYTYSAEFIANKAKPILEAGGRVFVAEAGQSNITADWVALLIEDGISNTKTNVIVIHHSVWNENHTDDPDLDFIDNNTNYVQIDDGNRDYGTSTDRGDNTPNYQDYSTEFIPQIEDPNNPNTFARSIWTLANDLAINSGYTGGPIPRGGMDFSDTVITTWIFDINHDYRTVQSFLDAFVINTPEDTVTTPVSPSPIENCSFPWTDNTFTISDQTVNYISNVIDISCASTVTISMNIEGVGNMEDADFLNVYYAVNGGSQQVISENVNAFANKEIAVSGISGDTLTIIINGATSVNAETYTISNIQIDEDTTTTPVTPTTEGTLVHIIKSNAPDYAIDGNHAGANDQNIYLWSESETNVNQQWIEIDRGNGYYSYQKAGTNYCIDGGNGGAKRQNVILWTCGASNENQHWEKVEADGAAYKLIKRNTLFALDGGNNGANGQNIALWSSLSTSQNLQWFISPINASAKALEKATNVLVYPNPAIDVLNIQSENGIKSVEFFTINGQKIINGSNNQLDLQGLSVGVYIIKIITADNRIFTEQVVKH